MLASGGKDGRIRLWDIPAGKLRNPDDLPPGLPGCTRPAVSLAGNGRMVAFTDGAGALTLADKETLKPLRRWTADEGGFAAGALSANGRLLVTSCRKDAGKLGPFCFWDPTTGRKLRSLPAAGDFLAVSPDGALAACQLVEGQVSLVETSSGKTVQRWKVEVDCNTAGCFSPDGKLFLAGDKSGRLHVWETATGKETRSWLAHGGCFISGCSFSSDGKQLATTGGDGFVAVWEVDAWKRLAWLDRHNCDWAPAALSPDGRLVASRGRNRALLLWDVRTGRLRCRLSGERVRLSDVVFDPTGRWLFTAGSNDTLLKWDVGQLKDEPLPEPPIPAVGRREVSAIRSGVFALNIRPVILPVWEGTLPPGARTCIEGRFSIIPCAQLALSPDGNVLVVANERLR